MVISPAIVREELEHSKQLFREAPVAWREELRLLTGKESSCETSSDGKGEFQPHRELNRRDSSSHASVAYSETLRTDLENTGVETWTSTAPEKVSLHKLPSCDRPFLPTELHFPIPQHFEPDEPCFQIQFRLLQKILLPYNFRICG